MNTPPKIPSNRLTAPRREPKANLKCCCRKGRMGLGPNVALTVLDVSESGIRLTVNSELKKGDDIEIELTFHGQSSTLRKFAEVAWCVTTADGTFCMGARWQQRLGYGEATALARMR